MAAEHFCPKCGRVAEAHFDNRFCGPVAAEREPEYVDYREPGDELGPFWLHLPRLRRRLAEHGLHLVTDADLRVLEGCLKLDLGEVRYLAKHHEHDWAHAELARRGEKP